MEAQKLVHEWAEATGNTLHHGETLRGVSVDDLVELVLAAERAVREQPAILSEIKTLEELLVETPEECVIDRKSLEARLKVLKSKSFG